MERADLGPYILQVLPALAGQSFYEIRHRWSLQDLCLFMRGERMQSELREYYAKKR